MTGGRGRAVLTAHEPNRNVSCLCGFKDLSDSRAPLKVLRGIRVLRRGKCQERIDVCELPRVWGVIDRIFFYSKRSLEGAYVEQARVVCRRFWCGIAGGLDGEA
jgi:hypothetical protein